MTGLAVEYQAVNDTSANTAVLNGPPLLHGTNIATEVRLARIGVPTAHRFPVPRAIGDSL
jgi:hypothetical protein